MAIMKVIVLLAAAFIGKFFISLENKSDSPSLKKWLDYSRNWAYHVPPHCGACTYMRISLKWKMKSLNTPKNTCFMLKIGHFYVKMISYRYEPWPNDPIRRECAIQQNSHFYICVSFVRILNVIFPILIIMIIIHFIIFYYSCECQRREEGPQ